jgi:hypothetical protein
VLAPFPAKRFFLADCCTNRGGKYYVNPQGWPMLSSILERRSGAFLWTVAGPSHRSGGYLISLVPAGSDAGRGLLGKRVSDPRRKRW